MSYKLKVNQSKTQCESRIIVLNKMLELIDFADLYELKLTREHLGSQIGKLFQYNDAYDLFDSSVLARLLSMVSPLGLHTNVDGDNELIMGEGGCKSLFNAMKEIISPDLQNFVQVATGRLVSNENFSRLLEAKFRVRGLEAVNVRVEAISARTGRNLEELEALRAAQDTNLML